MTIKKMATLLAATAMLAALPALAAGALDGKTFHGKLTHAGKSGGHSDNFEFKDGKFTSTSCKADGFGSGAYTTEGSGDNITFTAQTTSAKNGTMDWKGTIKGDTISGTAVWNQPGKPPKNMTFEAKTH